MRYISTLAGKLVFLHRNYYTLEDVSQVAQSQSSLLNQTIYLFSVSTLNSSGYSWKSPAFQVTGCTIFALFHPIHYLASWWWNNFGNLIVSLDRKCYEWLEIFHLINIFKLKSLQAYFVEIVRQGTYRAFLDGTQGTASHSSWAAKHTLRRQVVAALYVL